AAWLQTPHRLHRWIKEGQQHQRADVIKEQAPVSRPISLTSRLSQPTQQRLQTVQELQSLHPRQFVIRTGHRTSLSFWRDHQTTRIELANAVPNRIGLAQQCGWAS